MRDNKIRDLETTLAEYISKEGNTQETSDQVNKKILFLESERNSYVSYSNLFDFSFLLTN